MVILIFLVGEIVMVGVIGVGGLGFVVIIKGYNYFCDDIILVVIILILLLIFFI